MAGSTHETDPSLPRSGYDPDFLGTPVGLPSLDPSIQDDALLWNGKETIPYTHFSLSMSQTRRFARWVAWNIDGASIKLISRTNLTFTKDPRLPAKTQIGNELYDDNRLDRGHIARRSDLLWGTMSEAQQANTDSFRYTNITPQMDDFNQSSKQGVWGRLENALFEDVDVQNLRISVFGGPIFHADDREYRGVALPAEYWKLLVFQEQGVVKSRAFVLTQNLEHLREIPMLDEFRVYQITVAELEERTTLHFPAIIQRTGALTSVRSLGERSPLDGAGDIVW
ncbi:DNA/RNA non-specific endonuclease [Paeniglutamicibacter sp. ANT13_2]|uniref:DNA/RNA non-specific endonuclease n=2 Tax=Paeniglutamicibacter terrestris TaxID=2723403 RepID=A0ABX1G6C9_9MICC|nr:DNA/RNA non-specific endonuclease [Paeniglutamicibacter terrestris]NKG21832.1 DNA/RNA non-specific endonuclease [Paeniglutamicibacter terrestris]